MITHIPDTKPVKAAGKKFTAADIVSMLRVKYSDAYVVLEQVAAGTGAGVNSWIDAAIFSLWPSKGIWRAACEVKVSRADFLGELSRPSKNDWAREHFDYFWYVVAPGVAKDDEIPSGTGLMTVRGGGLSVVKQAPLREDVTTDKYIIASFARSLDKERQRFLDQSLHDAIEKHPRFVEAKSWIDGAQRFIKSCGDYCHPKSADDVFEKLTALARDKSPDAVAADHAAKVLGAFQDHVLHFLLDIAPLANSVLNARDETGKFLVREYQCRDMKSVDELKKAVRKRPKRYDRDYREGHKRDMESRELLKEFTE